VAINFEVDGPVAIVTIDRPDVANAIDRPTAAELADAFRRFEADPALSVAVLTGANGMFCAGADLKAIHETATLGGESRAVRVEPTGDGPVGPTRMLLDKPVIAAVEGHAVAGGLELALWCDLRIVAADAVFGVYCRRWGVPLMDGGTVRLGRLVGHGRALDLILTGRAVDAEEALQIGLATRVVPAGETLAAAVAMAQQMARLPQGALRSDRLSAYEQWSHTIPDALLAEYHHGMDSLATGETLAGVARYASGDWTPDEFA
jgi:enoyl-CoA hydratase